MPISNIENLKKVLGVFVKDIDEKYVLPSESKATVKDDIVNELAHDILFFEDWYFSGSTPDPDVRLDRLKGTSDNPNLTQVLMFEVDQILKELRMLNILPVEPDVRELVGKLAWYVENWDSWFYDAKVQYDQSDFLDQRGANQEIYYDEDYGDPETSPGISNAYDEEQMPHS